MYQAASDKIKCPDHPQSIQVRTSHANFPGGLQQFYILPCVEAHLVKETQSVLLMTHCQRKHVAATPDPSTCPGMVQSWSRKATSKPLDPKSFYINCETPILPLLRVPGIGAGGHGDLK